MQVAIPQVKKHPRKITKPASALTGRDGASEEIYAYVAARDTLLVEAEEKPTATTVKRVRLANDFVVNCLRPPGVPYAGQFLSEPDAVRELERCRDVSARIAALSNP
jgi:hypothetical protein